MFRGALDARASAITEEMKLAASEALAELVADKLSAECILPDIFDKNATAAVAKAVKEAAVKCGVAQIK